LEEPPPRRTAPAERAPAAAKGAAPGRCFATVVTEPDGARVLWGKRKLGRSPIRDVPVPCGEGTVSLLRERYRPVVREVSATAGARTIVDERLHRPPATLTFTSTPPRARFTYNDEDVGAAPRKLAVMRFETVHIGASLPGYEPWHKTLYVREADTKINAQLVPTAKTAAKTAAAGAKRPPPGR
jgi:hypothetical protein